LGQAPAKTWVGLQRWSLGALRIFEQARRTACRALGNICGCCRSSGLQGGTLHRPLLDGGPSREGSRIWWPCARSATSATEEMVGAGSLAQSASNGQSLPQNKTLRVAKTWTWPFSARAATAEQPEPHGSSFDGHDVGSSFQKKLWPRKHNEATSCRRTTLLGCIKVGRQVASIPAGHYSSHEIQHLGKELEASSLLGNESLDRADLEARLKRVLVAKLRRYLERCNAPLPEVNADQQQHVQAVVEAWELQRQRL